MSSSILLLELSVGDINEVKIVIKNLENMNIMINQLLKTSLILFGGITFKFELMSIKNTLDDALSELQIYFNHTHIKLEIEDSQSYSLYHDKLWMKEALKNIIVNALETLTDENCIYIHLRKKGEQYIFIIHNSGAEIKETDMEKIFIRYKTSSEFAENHYGIGLNLSLIIVKNHFGDIDVASNHDGVRFRILLPIIAEENKFNFE